MNSCKILNFYAAMLELQQLISNPSNRTIEFQRLKQFWVVVWEKSRLMHKLSSRYLYSIFKFCENTLSIRPAGGHSNLQRYIRKPERKFKGNIFFLILSVETVCIISSSWEHKRRRGMSELLVIYRCLFYLYTLLENFQKIFK